MFRNDCLSGFFGVWTKVIAGIVLMSFALTGSSMAGDSFLIIANGQALQEATLQSIAQQKRVVLLDGAATLLFERLHESSPAQLLLPEVILGDFDSIKPEVLAFFRYLAQQNGVNAPKVLFMPSQDSTDLEKGIQYCDQHGATSILITGALGGSRMDHTLANLSFLKKYFKAERSLKLVTDDEIIEYVKDSELKFSIRLNANPNAVGIFGFPKARVSTHGLTWEMIDAEVELGGPHSSSNYANREDVCIKVQGEALVTYPRI